jgi:hypothetical protein
MLDGETAKPLRPVSTMTQEAPQPESPLLSELFTPPGFSWSTPVNLGPNINTPGRDANPSLTSDELLIVFSRNGELHEARRATREEPFGPATKLVGPFVASKNQSSACLSGDGLQIVFSSGAIGEEQQDILLAIRKTRDEPFGEPVRLLQPINSSGEERNPILSPDGTILTLTTDRSDQKLGATLIFTRPTAAEEFNPTPTVDPHLQSQRNIINSFSGDGRGLLKTTFIDSQEQITWHTRTGETNTWSEGQPLPEPLSTLQFGAPFLSTDGNTLYFHSRSLPDGQGDLDLWMSRRVPTSP